MSAAPEAAPSWRPGASLTTLRQRAALMAQLRDFFAQRQVLEVTTPILSRGGATDPGLASLSTQISGTAHPGRYYLHTSPEFAMKRLLAAGSGPIYQLAPCFRDTEHSQRHNPEFWMLEWYRPGWSLAQLQTECIELVDLLLGPAAYTQMTYTQALVRFAGVHPFDSSLSELQDACVRFARIDAEDLDRDACLDLLISHPVEAALRTLGRVIIHDFPASQAALAKIHLNEAGHAVAKRFELYINGIEIANAYQELTQAQEQAHRFAADNQTRRAQGKPAVQADMALLHALEAGLPECSGIALGFDRLLMLSVGAQSLDEVLSFSLARC